MKPNLHAVLLLAALSCFVPAYTRAEPPATQPSTRYIAAKGSHDISIRREEWTDAARSRVLPVNINVPKDASAKMPVILISHGLGGSREGLNYLGDYWASFGYVTVQLQHPGSDESVWRDVPMLQRMAAMKRAANAQELIARAGDVRFAIDRLTELDTSDAELKGILALDRIGMSGHSFGAHTTLAVAGQRFPAAGVRAGALTDSRITAAIPLSPSAPTGDLDIAFGSITIPVFHMTGTEDRSPINDVMKPEERRLPYQHSNAGDAYLLVLTGADHMVFGGAKGADARLLGRRGNRENDLQFQTIVQHLSLAFWDRYLRQDDVAKAWLTGDVAKKEVQPMGTFEMKTAKGK